MVGSWGTWVRAAIRRPREYDSGRVYYFVYAHMFFGTGISFRIV